ncbi:MAG: hypothetical protein ACLFTK_16000, partial [Anaerolineales bacterium]
RDILHHSAQLSPDDDTPDILAQGHRISPDSYAVIPDPQRAAQRDDTAVAVVAWGVYAGLILLVLNLLGAAVAALLG